MIVTVDANLVAAVLLPLPYSEAATTLLTSWVRDDVTIVAPALLLYELTSVLRRYAADQGLENGALQPLYQSFLALPIQRFPPSAELGWSALVWAERLQQRRSYDAAYVALATSLQAPFWTADRRLVNGLRALGAAWAYWLGAAGGATGR